MPDQPPNPWDMVLQAVNRVETRLDRLVSVEVHQADVRRLDERITGVVADFGVDRQMRTEQNAARDARIEALTKALVEESANRRDAVDTETQRRVAATRWGLGILVAASGGVVAIIQLLGG